MAEPRLRQVRPFRCVPTFDEQDDSEASRLIDRGIAKLVQDRLARLLQEAFVYVSGEKLQLLLGERRNAACFEVSLRDVLMGEVEFYLASIVEEEDPADRELRVAKKTLDKMPSLLRRCADEIEAAMKESKQ